MNHKCPASISWDSINIIQGPFDVELDILGMMVCIDGRRTLVIVKWTIKDALSTKSCYVLIGPILGLSSFSAVAA